MKRAPTNSMTTIPGRVPALLVLVTVLSGAAGCDRAPESETDRPVPPPAPPVVVFTNLDDAAVRPSIERYTLETGIDVVLQAASLDVIGERAGQPPDLIIAGDSASLRRAVDRNLLRPVRSTLVETRVPENYREPDSYWTALALDSSTVVYNRGLLDADDIAALDSYAALADPRFRERLCLSSSAAPGRHALIALLVSEHGAREAEIVVRGWRANLAAAVYEHDARLLAAIAGRRCALGIVANSELSRFLAANGDADIARHWLDADGRQHIDLAGAGVARHAINPDGAVRLLEWLAEPDANSAFAADTSRLPVNPDAVAVLEAWPPATASPVTAASLGFLLEDAMALAERARYP